MSKVHLIANRSINKNIGKTFIKERTRKNINKRNKGEVMKKRRGKVPRTRKYVSLMVVPHNSNKVLTWKTTRPFTKIFSLLAFFLLIILTLSGYLAIVTRENQNLRNQYNSLNSFFIEQQDVVKENITAISNVKRLDNVSRDKLEEFSYQVQNLTENYIDKEMKKLSVSRSSISNNPASSFVGEIAELKALLAFLEDADKQEDELFTELSDKKSELEKYINHLPHYWPTSGVIGSSFGNRLHPIYKRYRNHTGVDIGGKSGAPIYASASGTITAVGKNGGYGYCIDVDHGNGLVTRYAHCSKVIVRKWQKVDIGEKIAEVGETGVATGPHLHFEILLNEVPIDPEVFIGTSNTSYD